MNEKEMIKIAEDMMGLLKKFKLKNNTPKVRKDVELEVYKLFNKLEYTNNMVLKKIICDKNNNTCSSIIEGKLIIDIFIDDRKITIEYG